MQIIFMIQLTSLYDFDLYFLTILKINKLNR